MQIDWFTFGAQIVNFLILVGLLKYFLYGPITAAMDAREQRIAGRLEEARSKRAEAEQEAAAYRQQQEALEAEREERLAEADAEARERRRALVEDARAEVDRMQAQWEEALRREHELFLQELAQRVSRETLDLARRTLDELARADLEAQVLTVFIERLDGLDAEARRDLQDALRAAEGTVDVRTAFPLEDAYRRRLTEALAAAAEAEVDPAFETEAEVGLGIEVRVGDYAVAWSLRSYFEALAGRIRDRIEAEITAETSMPALQNAPAPSDS